jgi:hypothetical protein
VDSSLQESDAVFDVLAASVEGRHA